MGLFRHFFLDGVEIQFKGCGYDLGEVAIGSVDSDFPKIGIQTCQPQGFVFFDEHRLVFYAEDYDSLKFQLKQYFVGD